MNITFLREAQLEFLDYISYYEGEQPGLGRRFKNEVDRTLLWVAERPQVCRLRRDGYRRINLRVFPYYIPYIVRGPNLWVLAVAHTRRKPAYWIERKKDVS